MNDLEGRGDPLQQDLRVLFDHEVGLAQSTDTRTILARASLRATSRHRGIGRFVALTAVVLALLGLAVYRAPSDQLGALGPTQAGSPQLTPAATVLPSTVPASALPSSAPPATRTPSPTPMAGSLVDGVPANLGGAPVFRGVALLDKIAASSDTETFLAGGWFHQGEVVRFCAFQRFDRAVDLCLSFGVYERRSGGEPLWVGRGDDGLLPEGQSEAADRPVVLLVHTHDPRCSTDDPGCVQRPVLSGVEWLGP